MSRPLLTAAVVTGLIATAAIAGSHAETNPTVKARQSHMQLNSFNLGKLGAMAQGEAEYDAEIAAAAAANLAALAALDQTAYWEPGTDAGTIEGTRALAVIWENPEGFAKLQADLAAATAAMAAVAGDGLEAVQGQMGAVGGVCGACHREFRVRQ